MEPTLRNGDYGLALAAKGPLWDPARGAIIVFTRAGDDADYVKRVVGLPGEEVQIKDGLVWINDRELAESYAQGSTVSDFDRCRLGVDEYFLLGDHRMRSRDSRNFGPVRRSAIVGRAILVGWPWSSRRLLLTTEQ